MATASSMPTRAATPAFQSIVWIVGMAVVMILDMVAYMLERYGRARSVNPKCNPENTLV